jgi:4-amino-4-deoxy-L-arabinose transferase-like glycosyltransferase
MRSDFRDWILGAAIIGVVGSLYFLTAARDIVVGDTGELITAAVSLGVAHPPGYPLFTMLGHLLSLLPFGSVPFRVNLLGVVCGTLTTCLVYFTAIRLTRSRLAGMVAALFLAVNPTFWAWSLVAEVFSLNNLLAASVIYFLVLWQEQPERTGFLVAASFVSGLALTNHQTFVLLGPAVCLVLWQRRAFFFARPAIVGYCVVVFFLGLLPYLYVPWASAHHPIYNWGNVSSARDLIHLITRRDYGSHRLVSTPGYGGGSHFLRIIALCRSFGPLAAVLIALGAFRAYQSRRWYFWFTLIAFVFAGPFFVWISNLNIATAPSALFVLQRFFLLSHVVVAPLLAFGVLFVAETIVLVVPAVRAASVPIVAGIVFIAAVGIAAANYRQIDQSNNSIARRFGEDVFATADPGSVLLGTGDGVVIPLIYLQTVEGLGQHVTLIPFHLLAADWYVRQLRERHPDLIIPFDRYDAESNNLKMLVESNPTRNFYFIGSISDVDHSLDRDYWACQAGMLNVIKPKSKRLTVEQMVDANDQLLKRYRPPEFGAIRRATFEHDILDVYAWPAFRFGGEYERAGATTEASHWYERALAMDPDLAPARDGLARVR